MALDEVIILADPKGKGYKFAREVFDYVDKRDSRKFLFSVKFGDIGIHTFRDGEKKIRSKENVRKRTCFFIHDSNKDPATWFLELNFVNEALKFSDAEEIIDVIPYLRFARQDRKDQSRVSLNSRVVADCISLYADRVITVDVHALQIQGFYDIPFDNLYSFPQVVDHLTDYHMDFLKNLVVMSPDTGGAPRARAFKNKLTYKGIDSGFAVGDKYRPKEGEVGKEYKIIGDVKDKNVLIVDDLVDSGNSLIEAAKALKAKGAKLIYTYATHGLFTEGIEKLTSQLDLVMISDTLYREPEDKLKIISLVPLFGEAIYRTAIGESLSELFKVKEGD